MRIFFIAFIFSTITLATFGQEHPDDRKIYTTNRVGNEPVRIDGVLNDKAWERVDWATDFTQRQPDDGAAPSVQTKFKVLYDDKNLYLAFKCLDPEPSKIVSRLSRRDGFDGDRVEVNIDSYFDKRTAFSFTASVSGVKGDEYVSNNGNDWDSNWDPIWYLETSIDNEGWIAEMRIPLSQLRFADKPEHVWGIQVMRLYFRNDERSHWQYIPQDANGWVHLFGELHGLKGIKPQKQLEIQPYIVAQTERFEKEEGNPFATGKGSDVTVGLDAKVGITSDITLDMTVNPDFGQVEADPSQVNLTAFQLFFPEQRPFFIEGNNILNFPTGNGNDNLFYSRRIGRRPQGSINTDNDDSNGDGSNDDDGVTEYVRRSNNSRILGSLKLTGKNKKGFSWGVLESVTRQEEAEIDSLGHRRFEVIEPSTNYFVGRVQQDLDAGKTVFGGMVTATNRKDLNGLNHLPQEAYSAGVDFTHFWLQRKYFLRGRFTASQVKGSTEAITRLQQSPERFYQRTNNHYRSVDTLRRELEGTSGNLMFGKRSGELIYDIGASWNSPGLELNDIGFLAQTDRMDQWSWVQYRKLNPFGIFRSMRINAAQRQRWDFGGEKLGSWVNTDAQFQFKNFYQLSTGAEILLHNASNADLRGGPSIIYPRSYEYWLWAGTDPRKNIRFELNPWWSWSQDNFSSSWGWWSRITLRPSNAININLTGSISNNLNEMQYVATITPDNETRYLVGKIDQMTYNMSLRVTYVMTPNLSLQYWGQPFAASGAYSNLKRVTNPTAENYNNRFDGISTSLNEATGMMDVDENGDGETDYSIDNPDFNFTQFQSNMVLRWEYIPGSTLFLVWTQSLAQSPSVEDHSFNHLYSSLFDKTPRNIFLLKYTYRFLL